MEQTSLATEFEVEKTTTTVVKYKMTVPLKKCKKCKEWKPKSEFGKHKGGRGGLRSTCKDCDVKCTVKYQESHMDVVIACRDRYREVHKEELKERGFLYYKSKKNKNISGFYYGQGICLICGEFHPLKLENHHVIPDDDMVVSLCSNCHGMRHSNISEIHMISVLNAIENSKFLWREQDEFVL